MKDENLNEALQRAQSRLTLLADLSEALAGTLDAREGLERVCRLLAQRLGDWCAIDLVHGDERLERVCAGTRKNGGERCDWSEGPPCPPPAGPSVLINALQSAKPVLWNANDLRRPPREGAWETVLAGELVGRGATSAIFAPLRARRHVMGILSVARCGQPPLGRAELAILKGLAHRVGLSLDNARLHADAERIAERLQRSLLSEIPEIPGVAAAARYVPSSTAAQVGGDWYDLFELPGGRTAVIVGDVVGHDLRAAISMSQLRNMLRGIACDREEPPEAIIRRLDTATCALLPGTYTTCVYAVLYEDPADRGWRFDYTSAGHPPPLLITSRGEARYLEAGLGPPLGIDPDLKRTSASETIPADATVLLYTDGLIERRGEPLSHGLTRLRRHATTLADDSPDTLCTRLLESMVRDTEDDVVLLATRVGGSGKSLPRQEPTAG